MGLLSDIGGFGKDLLEDAEDHARRLRTIGDFIVRNATGDKLDTLRDVGKKLSEWGKKGHDFFKNSALGRRLVRAAKTPIPAAGQKTIELMRLTTGFGEPVDGERFGWGASRFGDVGQTLTGADPTSDWDSGGSHAYAGQNTRQLSRVETAIEADQLVAGVLTREAGQISASRDKLESEADWLADVSLVTAAVSLIPYVGKAAATTAEIAAVTKAVGASGIELTNLSSAVNTNAAQITRAAGQYAGIANGAVVPGNADFGPSPGGDGPRRAPDGPPESQPRPGPPAPSAPWPTAPSAPSSGGGGGAAAGGGGGAAGGAAPSPGVPPPSPGSAGTTVPAPPAASTPPAAAVPGGAPIPATGSGPAGSALGSMLGPLGGLLTGAVQAAAQRGAPGAPPTGAAPGPGGSRTVEENTDDGKAKDAEEAPGENARDDTGHEPSDSEGDRDGEGQDEAGAAPGGDGRVPAHILAEGPPDRPPADTAAGLGGIRSGSPAAPTP